MDCHEPEVDVPQGVSIVALDLQDSEEDELQVNMVKIEEAGQDNCLVTLELLCQYFLAATLLWVNGSKNPLSSRWWTHKKRKSPMMELRKLASASKTRMARSSGCWRTLCLEMSSIPYYVLESCCAEDGVCRRLMEDLWS